MFKRIIKNIVTKVLDNLGYEISKSTKRGWNPTYLKSLSNAEVVLDIGAANGTSVLYEAFKERKFFLFEPLIEYKEKLNEWSKKMNCEVEYLALGDKDGEITINIDPRRKTMSSIAKRSDLTKATELGIKRSIRIRKLDSIVDNYLKLDQRLILKIDVEGYELNVLKGAQESLKRTDLIIVETSIADLYKEEFGFLDLLKFMDENEFKLFDILHLAYYKDWKGLMWVDLVFVPKDKQYQYS